MSKAVKHHWYGDTSPWTEQRLEKQFQGATNTKGRDPGSGEPAAAAIRSNRREWRLSPAAQREFAGLQTVLAEPAGRLHELVNRVRHLAEFNKASAQFVGDVHGHVA